MPDTLSRRADELAVDILQACADRQAVLGLIHRYGDARVAAHIDTLTAAVEAALTSEDEIAHGEAYEPSRGGLGVCAYCNDAWPCRTQRGINHLRAILNGETPE